MSNFEAARDSAPVFFFQSGGMAHKALLPGTLWSLI